MWGYFSRLFSFLLVILSLKAGHRIMSESRSQGILSIWCYWQLFSATHKAPKVVGGRGFSFTSSSWVASLVGRLQRDIFL